MFVLYAEDDIDDFIFLEEILIRVAPGSQCINARHGREALQMLEELVVLPDLIILDINMPTMDGKACLKDIKNDDRFKRIPVIIYTTSANERDREQCLQLGAERCLTKPNGVAEAEMMIREALTLGTRNASL